MLAEIWQWTPLMFLLVLTGLMNLPENQVRAAYVLGASRTRIFFRIMLPLLMPVIVSRYSCAASKLSRSLIQSTF